MQIKNNDCFELWKLLLQGLTEKGSALNNSRAVSELLNVTTVLTSLSGLTKPIEYLRKSNEWVYPTAQQIERAMLKPSSPGQQEYSYGPRLFGFESDINQIDTYVIPRLQKKPHSRRACAVVMKPQDISLPDGVPMTSVIAIDFMVRENKLVATMLIRSLDAYIGWPANCYQLFTIANYVASKLGCDVGTLTIHAVSAHLFEEHKGNVKQLLNS